MTRHPTPPSRRLGAAAVVLALVGTLLSVASPAGALPTVDVQRASGPDRYATAAAVALTAYEGAPRPIDGVILASGEGFADGLAASSIAGAIDAPVLLTAKDTLPAVTIAALADLRPETVYIVGGNAAIGPGPRTHLAALGWDTHEIRGNNRYHTAAEISEFLRTSVAPIGMFNGRRTAIVATGNDFPDALAGGALAARRRHPILLVGSTLPAPTAAELAAANIQQVIILGGTSAVPLTVQTAIGALGITTIRVNGPNRHATAAALGALLTTPAPAGFGFSSNNVFLVSGQNFADALSGGPWAARSGTGSPKAGNVILLAGSVDTLGYIRDRRSSIGSIQVIGGTGSVVPADVSAARAAATGP